MFKFALNAVAPIEVTLFGMLRVLEQPLEKAPPSMVFRFLLNVISVRLPQKVNALYPIVSTQSGIITLVRVE